MEKRDESQNKKIGTGKKSGFGVLDGELFFWKGEFQNEVEIQDDMLTQGVMIKVPNKKNGLWIIYCYNGFISKYFIRETEVNKDH